jgi:uncharacterized membrane protein YeaQ/YmgE (transglycosylase-associated protein family)
VHQLVTQPNPRFQHHDKSGHPGAARPEISESPDRDSARRQATFRWWPPEFRAADSTRKVVNMGLLWFLIIGALAGWLAGQFMRGNGFGLLGDIIVGIIGAFIGGYLFWAAGVRLGGGLIGSLIVAFVGAVVLLFLVRLVNSRRGGRRLFS